MERVEKQTAIEWLVTRIAHGGLVGKKQFDELVKQAKAMEKERIIEAHKQSSIESGFEDSAEDWANEYWDRNYGV